MTARLREFPRTFWLANVMELFERGAYYGLNSVLAVYLVGKVSEGGLGFDEQAVSVLLSLVYAAVYLIPIVGGVLADRYGYRRMLTVAFALLALGYFLSGRVQAYGLVLLFMLVMALGAGLFKPIISGTIARTTDERTSGVGFAIYYWMINVGAFLAPLVVTYLRGFSWRAVFTASAVYAATMLVANLLFFREPPRPDTATRSLRQALLGAAEVLTDSRFMLMIVIYSGFWILYFQNFSTVLWYLEDFVPREAVSALGQRALDAVGLAQVSFTFGAEHVTTINAGMIILLQFIVGKLVERRRALPVMITGILIGAVGFGLLAISQSPWLFIAGIAVFSIGEMTAHPKYISLCGLIAPPDRKAVYMGYAFLYGVFGALLGSNLGGIAYKEVLKPAMGTPEAARTAALFWGVLALLAVATALGLSWFARRFSVDNAATRRQARIAMAVVYCLLAAIGTGFVVVALRAEPLKVMTLVQAVIFILLGMGGLTMTLRSPRPEASSPAAAA